MNKHATIYERKGKIFIGTDSLTTAGIWLGDGQITLLQSLDIPYEIGSAVLAALANSRSGVHHPEQHEWSSLLKELMKPLYIAAGVKSWSAFQSDARCITVNLHEGIIIIEPSKKDGRGYGPVSGHDERLPYNAEPQQVGEAILRALEACE